MRWFRLVFFAALLLSCFIAPQWIEAQQNKSEPLATATTPPDFAKSVRPLLKSYCFECHNSTKRKAGLDLEKIESNNAAVDLVDLWDQVGERMRAKEMPPSKNKQPTDDERKQILAWVKHASESKVQFDKLPKEELEKALAGNTMNRRLNRLEYNNTLRDLFGVDLHPGDLLPSEGGGGEGFDNAGPTLFTTPTLMEKYLEAAELVLSTLLPARSSPISPSRAAPAPDSESQATDAQLKSARKALLVAVPGPKTTPREAARKILETFVPRAFRRPATAKEIDRYLGIFEKASKRGDSYEQSLKLALKGVLVSPSFLFLSETPPEKSGVYQLDHYEIASHLSYFLWASTPDEELLQLASQSKLHDEKVLRGEVQRMMRDPRSRGLADGFAAQWLGIRPLGGTIRPDARVYPEFDEALGAAMREETLLFFDSIVREDRSLLEIIDADYTFVNERLAAHYKIDDVKGPQMRRIELDDPARGGVLGQAAILTVTSFPHRTSPVLRGRWILEELLGAEVPPPPPDVPVLNERKKGGEELTFRQQLEKHRSKAECASCHGRMDPLGFGLENFDALGRWRTEQGGKPIDSVGVMPTGEKFSGPAELKKLLLEKRRPEFVRNLCRKTLGYALGREINRADACVIQDCAQALEKNEFKISSLLESVVVSFPFSHRNQGAVSRE
jgi:mono/diheme cytochrome c family protein